MLLGSIGTGKEYILEEDYTNTAFVEYQQPIKLSSSILPFTKRTYKLFNEASKKQPSDLKINYTDSLVEKPKFVQLHISDKVTVLEQLNNKNNEELIDYLKVQPEAKMVTSISLALNQEKLNQLQTAEGAFLTQSGYKHYVISLYKEGEPIDQIQLNDGAVFAYETSSFCWKENKRRQLQIVDITNGDPCPKKTYSNSRKVIKEENYFKL
ncbi:hypothetical protein [Mesonia sp. K4-1]|uniref:hypothetical protein n=1 Tax=Mesonia sp. K4-1 TaxID=2602760 RepID=UPI0011C848DB|nr:hypothetical protein [Mesonia sp. K4-1]TXK78899.1 hypothetical protein FT986_03625 [Mesonia sp. K4-1]